MIPVSNLPNITAAPVQAAPIDEIPDYWYSPQSPLGELFNHSKSNQAGLKLCIAALNTDDRNLLYGMVYQCAGSPSTHDLQWGEHHVFDDMTVLQSAISEVIKLKYERLTDSQRDIAHENLYRLAGEPDPSYEGAEWGRLCALNNLPRLADVMDENKRVAIETFPAHDVNCQFDLKLTKAINRFKTHPVYQQLLQKNVFSTEMEMRDYYTESIAKGTCKAQATELNKISDGNPRWNRHQLLTALKSEDVFYNSIIMFSRAKIEQVKFGRLANAGSYNAAEQRQLNSMHEWMKISEPNRELIESFEFIPDDKTEYKKIYDLFISDLKSHKNDNNFHGMVRIKNMVEWTSNENDVTAHAIFFQHLKKESVFRLYDIGTGFNEYFTQDGFMNKLQKVICGTYVLIADPRTTVNYAVYSKELTYPCKSTLGQFYQLAMQDKDLNKIKAAFSLLTRDEQCTIYGLVYKYYGEPATPDLHWGEHHVFDNAEILIAAATYGIIERYQQSSAAKKLSIEREVALLDENYQNHIPLEKWGRLYALNNLPRLADAIEATP